MNHMTRGGRDGMKDGQTLRTVFYEETVFGTDGVEVPA